MKHSYLLGIIIVSTGVVTLFAVLGPYEYKFPAPNGLWYYYLSILLMCLAITLARWVGAQDIHNGTPNAPQSLSRPGERVVQFALGIALLSSVLFAVEIIRIFSADVLLQGGDFREAFSDTRSRASKILEIFSCLGPAGFLIMSSQSKLNFRSSWPLALVALVAMGSTGLLLGARWKLFLCVLIFLFASHFRRRRSEPGSIDRKTARKLLFVGASLAGGAAYAFYSLFAVRGLLSADSQFRFYIGDMPLKPWAREVFLMTDGAVEPLYRLADYVGQSPYVFSTLFVERLPNEQYYGAFLARPLGYILPTLGLEFPTNSEIASETFTGMYSGTAYGLIVDFGVGGALLGFVVTGWILGLVENRARVSRFAGYAYPLVCAATACSPIYYLYQAGYADYIFTWLCRLITIQGVGVV